MRIVFPIGLWIFSLACNLIWLAGAPGDAWSIVAFYSMAGGLIGVLCAAVPRGSPPVKKITMIHITIKLSLVVLYAIKPNLSPGTKSLLNCHG